jgi:Zn-finger nucleic acid-binding protein
MSILSSMASRCPRCGHSLTKHQTASATLEGCLTCGGIFLDRESRIRVVAAKCVDSAAASDLAAAHARWSPDVRTPCACPICSKPMHCVKVAGSVDLDVCDDHGAWFDRHELRRFIDALSEKKPGKKGNAKKKAAIVGAAAAVGTAAVVAADDDKVETALEVADVGFSVLEVFGEILGAIAD